MCRKNEKFRGRVCGVLSSRREFSTLQKGSCLRMDSPGVWAGGPAEAIAVFSAGIIAGLSFLICTSRSRAVAPKTKQDDAQADGHTSVVSGAALREGMRQRRGMPTDAQGCNTMIAADGNERQEPISQADVEAARRRAEWFRSRLTPEGRAALLKLNALTSGLSPRESMAIKAVFGLMFVGFLVLISGLLVLLTKGGILGWLAEGIRRLVG
ncbi:unnamed protein product [Vitrella brassicaformis CCMP3155]|uniref:Uncharacterized protein n=2 Tax=Vitrella brassicaformis TaxID=1169539 RepID=A0A0G4H6J3_VITBC|nr:unnamed protein product [Vitrella brassicaformis CCMP3155]|eukprot:CEM39239.1 unnamed protein product [Vitrella brassicaformis CCMP3155]